MSKNIMPLIELHKYGLPTLHEVANRLWLKGMEWAEKHPGGIRESVSKIAKATPFDDAWGVVNELIIEVRKAKEQDRQDHADDMTFPE